MNCTSVAFTYNDPVIWAEYAIDTAKACHDQGIKTVAVTAGYITSAARPEFFQHFDAANIDLKAFTEKFYFSVTSSHLANVLETLVYLKQETDVWFEITNLVIPDENDSPDELRRMCDWIYDNLGPDVPVHFSAFHPDYRMMDRPRTPPETLHMAHQTALQAGIRFPYVGNIHDQQRQNTYCPSCHQLLIERDWYQLGAYNLIDSKCRFCQHLIPGHFTHQPGDWGPKRQPVNMDLFQIEGKPMLEFTQPEKTALLTLAAETIVASVTGVAAPKPSDSRPGDSGQPENQQAENLKCLSEKKTNGVFVTLHKHKRLRGCCGTTGNGLSLLQSLKQSADRTALNDHRFPPVRTAELADLDLEISVLGPSIAMRAAPQDRPTHIQIGRHGLRIRSGNQTGLLLPHVATEQGWNSLQFLQAVCRKAGLESNAWENENVVLETFEGICFGGPFTQYADQQNFEVLPVPDFLNPTQLADLTRWLSNNFFSIQAGAIPQYYAPDVPDADVSGLIISAQFRSTGKTFSAFQFQSRPVLAMQSQLFQMIDGLAKQLPTIPSRDEVDFNVAVLTDARSLSETQILDESRFQPTKDALLAQNASGYTLTWDRNATHADIKNTAISRSQSSSGAVNYLAFRCFSLMNQHSLSHLVSKTDSTNTRPPAVHGRFYPADDNDRDQLVEQLIQRAGEKYPQANSLKHSHENLLAIMTPHAGLKYSGTVAAAVWSNITIPEDVIIISPKHTNMGAAWSVAPFAHWRLSDEAAIEGNSNLANEISKHVTGMTLDAEAHRNEHGIEVQLPFLSKLAPQSRLTGIAMQAANWSEIEVAARQFADFLSALPNLPLLVISSDMNHFASDDENRRLDQIALDAFDTGDGRLLLEVCREHSISMCGVIPAGFVLETLRNLSNQISIRQLAYATSAETSGQTDRVVGYASSALMIA